jgi:glutathione S-transferase
MSPVFRIFGSEMSPYSVKVRSWFRFKGIPHAWLLRTPENAAEYQQFAKLPIIPLVVTPEAEGIQDSTPIIERLESRFPEPATEPPDPTAAFISALVEEFGDEWGNKWMFHFRWAREVDQLSAAGRIARSMAPGDDEAAWMARTQQIRARMVDRVWFVGSNATTTPLIESSLEQTVRQLDDHLAARPYLFGARPAFGDFGLWGQLYEAWTDPTAGALIEGRAQNLLAWIQRMLWPRVEGPFEDWDRLAPTLMPFLATQIGGRFMPWTLANADAIARGADEFSVAIQGGTWVQKPQKYHAKSLQALRQKYLATRQRRSAAEQARLDGVLADTGCLDGLRRSD